VDVDFDNSRIRPAWFIRRPLLPQHGNGEFWAAIGLRMKNPALRPGGVSLVSY